MASLYKRGDSPFWWIKFRDPATGKVKQQSTGFRIGNGIDFGKARAECAKKSLAEAKNPTMKNESRWAGWVPEYIELRYGTAPMSLIRNRNCWRFISQFLDERQVFGPAHLTREICMAYIPWRRRKIPEEGFNGVGLNTALLELKLLAVVMGEAVRRRYIEFNCCRELGIKKEKVAPKAEMTDEDIGKIRAAIAKRCSPEWDYQMSHDWPHIFNVTFEIALAQGCRLSETHLDVWRDVDLDNLTIKFRAKGNRYYETALNPSLVPLFKRLREAGRKMTFDMPERRTMVSLAWHKLLKKIGLGHLQFHCTRVTAISRLERAGAKAEVVKKLVNHSSELVHAIYRRVHSSELQQFWPSLPAAQTTAETGHGSDANPQADSAATP